MLLDILKFRTRMRNMQEKKERNKTDCVGGIVHSLPHNSNIFLQLC